MRKIILLLLILLSPKVYAVHALGTGVINSGGNCGSGTSIRTSSCLLATASHILDRDGVDGNVASLTANLKVSEPDSAGTPIGTIVLLAGGGSSGFYEQLTNTTNNVILPLLASNWRVIQLAWENNGGNGVMGGSAGSLALAGRSATIFKTIHDTPSLYVTSTPFVISGQSGGSDQIAYSLAQYGAGSYIDAAILTSGPPHARQDYGAMGALKPSWNTLGQTLMNVSVGAGGQLAYGGGDAAFVDSSYGSQTAVQVHAFDGGPGNLAFRDSVMNGTAEYRYPQTQITFVFGDADSSVAMCLGKLYSNSVTGKSKTVSNTTGSVGHTSVPGSTSGSGLILAAAAASTFNH